MSEIGIDVVLVMSIVALSDSSNERLFRLFDMLGDFDRVCSGENDDEVVSERLALCD